MGRPLVVEADGGSRGNPGKAGYGALVRDPATGAVLAERAASVGIASNNVAEYSGLVAGLEAAAEIDPGADVQVRMDSKLVVEQMSGRWKIKHGDMRRLAALAGEVAERIGDAGGSVRFSWIPRAENAAADRLANAAMDGQTIRRRLDVPREAPGANPRPGPSEALEPAAPPGAAAAPKPGGPKHPARTRLLLVRHGVTDFTVAGRLDGRGGADPALNEAGRDQARRAGAAVVKLVSADDVSGPVTVVTSSLSRARDTGAAVAEALRSARLEVSSDEDAEWDEQDFGDWDGRTVALLRARYPDEWVQFADDPAYARPGGETQDALAARVVPAFERAAARDGTVVVATHRKPVVLVLAHVLAIPAAKAWRLATSPASLTCLELAPDGAVSVAFVNDTNHLR